MLTVKEVLDGKIGIDLRCVDSVLLKGWVRSLPMPGGVVNFIREQQGCPIPSPAGLGKLSDACRKGVEQFAVERRLRIVAIKKGESKEEVAPASGGARPVQTVRLSLNGEACAQRVRSSSSRSGGVAALTSPR